MVVTLLYYPLSLDFLDGRPLPRDPNPAWMGYSVGHWDGDTLVVETTGFNNRTWLDIAGHPHSEQLRVTERFRRIDFRAHPASDHLRGPADLDQASDLLAGVELRTGYGNSGEYLRGSRFASLGRQGEHWSRTQFSQSCKACRHL